DRGCGADELEGRLAALGQGDPRPHAELAEPFGGTLEHLLARGEETLVDRPSKVSSEALLAGGSLQVHVRRQHIELIKALDSADDQRRLPEASRGDQDDVDTRAQVGHQGVELTPATDEVFRRDDLAEPERRLLYHGARLYFGGLIQLGIIGRLRRLP